MMLRSLILLILVSSSAIAHEQTPTYATWSPSHIEGVVKTEVQIFNKRDNVDYFEIEVFTPDFKSLSFVTTWNIIEVAYLERKSIDIYMTEANSLGAQYICSMSKIRSEDLRATGIASQICTKLN